ncbi:hypothetical protein H8356DRAFT_1321972 [Neocallimastix lanati (nom. inval.)]|nr:hypothetical protein H8356DRAFT_1321972 [Neocallimastix sp. JGI-2020a]
MIKLVNFNFIAPAPLGWQGGSRRVLLYWCFFTYGACERRSQTGMAVKHTPIPILTYGET